MEKLSVCRDNLQFRSKRERILAVIDRHPIEAVFPAGTSFSGLTEADGLVRIEGEYRGIVKAPIVVIAGESLVTAEIESHCLYVEGHYRGLATVSFLYLTTNGVIEGDIKTESLFIEPGASCRGKLMVAKGINGYACDTREVVPRDLDQTDQNL